MFGWDLNMPQQFFMKNNFLANLIIEGIYPLGRMMLSHPSQQPSV